MISRLIIFCAKWALIAMVPIFLFSFLQKVGRDWGIGLCQYIGVPTNDQSIGTFFFDFPQVFLPAATFLGTVCAAYLSGIGSRMTLRIATVIAAGIAAWPIWVDVGRVFPANRAAIFSYWSYYEQYGDLMLGTVLAVSAALLVGIFLVISQGPRRLQQSKDGRVIDKNGPWRGKYDTMFALWWRHFWARNDGIVIGERYERCKEINWDQTPWGSAVAWVCKTLSISIIGGGSAPLIRANPKGHLLTLAGSGAGKSTGYAIVNLLLGWWKTWIVMDISSELWRATARVRELLGRRVVYINPSDPDTWGCNVVANLGKTPETRDVDAKKIIGWIKSQQAAGGGGGNEVFTDHGWSITQAIIMIEMIRSERENRPWSLATVAQILLSADIEAQIQGFYLAYPEVADLLGPVLATAAVETRSGYYANATKNMKTVADATGKRLWSGWARRNFELTDLIRGGTDLYIRMNTDDLPMFKSGLQLFFGALNTEIRRACESENPEFCKGDKLREQLVYLLDEFPQIASRGESCTILQGLETMRKYNVIYWLFAQFRGQYLDVYGKDRGATVDECSYIQMFVAVQNPEQAQQLAARAGKVSVKLVGESKGESAGGGGKGMSENVGQNTSTQKDDLVSPEDIMMMCTTDEVPDEQLIVQRGKPIARVGICRWYRRPSLVWLHKLGKAAGPVVGPKMIDVPETATKAA